ncbi:MAG: glycoside hydrolase family 3 N-terminal domain-containing protein [Bacteroidales bacterium]
MTSNNFNFYKLLLFTSLIFSFCSLKAEVNYKKDKVQKQWVDSVMNSLSLREKIGQLMLVRANEPSKAYDPRVSKWIKDYNIGGVTFFKGHPTEEAKITNQWQSEAKTPLLVSIDGEWGLSMRLDSTISYPLQMTLGAISNDSLIYLMGKEIAYECKRLGIQFNFAPVMDINSNPNNPIIGMRSFGENKFNVSKKGIAYMNGLQDGNLISTAKHFPGHGDTENDSHKTLPIVAHSKRRIDSVELFPFKQAIKNNLSGIMIAHLYMPAIEKKNNLPTSLSHKVVTKLLKNRLGFKGLIVTDGLEMQGVTKYYKPGDIEVKAILAGNDILLLPQNVPLAIQSIEKAIRNKTISEKRINQSCRKILEYKYKVGLNKKPYIETKGLFKDLNNSYGKSLRRKLFEEAITLVQNKDSIIPLKYSPDSSIVSLTIGYGYPTSFQKSMADYAKVKSFNTKEITEANQKGLINKIIKSKPQTIIVSLENTNISARKNFGVSQSSIDFVNALKANTNSKIILDIFAAPYVLKDINPDAFDAILISYQDKVDAKIASTEVIFGGLAARGKLPVSGSIYFPVGTGIMTTKTKIAYNASHFDMIDDNYIQKADSILNFAYDHKAFPGCQVIAIKDGRLIYERNLGFHTLKKNIHVSENDLYDIASITKIAATTLAIMKLDEEGKIDIDRKLSDYLLYLKGTNKENMIIREIMAHQAGLKSWIPFYIGTMDEDHNLKTKVYSDKISEDYDTRVAENLYINHNYNRIIFDSIIQSPIDTLFQFTYSDLGFYLFPKLVELVTNKSFDTYVAEEFYIPLGLETTGFLPKKHFNEDRIVPTEIDNYYRNQLIQGDVHDPGAAMLGGVSGHAGLFSNARDLAIIMQMLLNGGTYGNKRILKAETIEEFTRYQFPLNENRRGAGFDKPLLDYHPHGPNCYSASSESFGHSGFTGTYLWADPKNKLIYVFLSNRVYPTAKNKMLLKKDIRTNVHESLYNAVKK